MAVLLLTSVYTGVLHTHDMSSIQVATQFIKDRFPDWRVHLEMTLCHFLELGDDGQHIVFAVPADIINAWPEKAIVTNLVEALNLNLFVIHIYYNARVWQSLIQNHHMVP